MTTSAGAPRRSQEQRSAATRTRILDAAVECLTRYGYAGTSTPRIAEAAGLTRGAQVHHFGSKHELMAATIHHMTARTVATVVASFRRGFTSTDDPLGAILELIWDSHAAPGFVPVAELWVAARTDPLLAHEVAKCSPIMAGAVTAAILESVPAEHHQAMLDFVYTAMDVLRGILIPSFADRDPAQARRRWDRAAAGLRRMPEPSLTAWLGSAGVSL